MAVVLYPQMTPSMYATGTWSVRAPFSVGVSTTYTCIAIRSFADMRRDSQDVQASVYTPVGLTDGVVINNSSGNTFSLSNEETLGINIITLSDNQGNYLLIPDNYITGYPSSTNMNYKEIILSCNLGALPANMDFTLVKNAVAAEVQNVFGVSPTVNVSAMTLTTTPTYAEAIAAERARLAAVSLSNSQSNQITQLNAQVTTLQQQVTALTNLCKANNLIPNLNK